MTHFMAMFLDGIVAGIGVFIGIGIADWADRKITIFKVNRKNRKKRKEQ